MQIQTHQFSKYQANIPPTFIVVGLARGGTSLFAGILHAMGLFMGDDLTEPNYEDRWLTRAFRSGNDDEIERVICSYNQSSKMAGWAFKNPALNYFIINRIGVFRNPVILLVKKEISSVVRRRTEVKGQSYYVSLIYVYLTYHWLKWKAILTGAPVVIVDYDMATKHSTQWIEQFCQLFSRLPLNQKEALSFIKKGNDEYLKWKESCMQWMHTPFTGFVDIISPYQIAGWALHRKNNNPVLVEVRLNGETIAATSAMIYREDVNRRLHGSNGNCGFNFSFDTPLSEAELSNIEVCVDGSLFLDSSKALANISKNSRD